MKTTKMVQNLLLISFLFLTQTLAAAQSNVNHDPTAPLMEVVFNGTEGEYLLFTVKSLVTSKSVFVIKNEMGEDLHREVYYEGNNIRRIKIQKTDLRSLHFILSQKKKQSARTFKINTQYIETVNVLETSK